MHTHYRNLPPFPNSCKCTPHLRDMLCLDIAQAFSTALRTLRSSPRLTRLRNFSLSITSPYGNSRGDYLAARYVREERSQSPELPGTNLDLSAAHAGARAIRVGALIYYVPHRRNYDRRRIRFDRHVINSRAISATRKFYRRYRRYSIPIGALDTINAASPPRLRFPGIEKRRGFPRWWNRHAP